MSMIHPFGETAEQLLADGDEFAFLVLADHLDEIGLGDFARMIREGEWHALRSAYRFLQDSGFNPSSMKLRVELSRRGKFRSVRNMIGFKTLYTKTGFPGIRVAFYRENPTPSLFDPFSADPVRPRARRRP